MTIYFIQKFVALMDFLPMIVGLLALFSSFLKINKNKPYILAYLHLVTAIGFGIKAYIDDSVFCWAMSLVWFTLFVIWLGLAFFWQKTFKDENDMKEIQKAFDEIRNNINVESYNV